MMTDFELAQLRAAVASLCTERASCVPWAALLSLSEIQTAGFCLTIDMQALETVGAPIVVAQSLARADAALSSLSPRERDVVALLARGLSNKTIARELAISVATVKDHVHKILSKAGASSRSQIASMLHAKPVP